MKFTFDATEFAMIMTPSQWVLLLTVLGWTVREIRLIKPMKRLKLMDKMNRNLIKEMHPSGELLTQKQTNQMFMDAFSENGTGLKGMLSDGFGKKTRTGKSARTLLKELDGIAEELVKSVPGETVAGATIVIPNNVLANFLQHIEIDGFSGDVSPGPMPEYSSVSVPVTGPEQMQPLTNSIATWEAMRKDVNNN